MSDAPSILFTAFEPSGDDHAAAVIGELRRRHPDLVMHAWGGPRMARAGASIVSETGKDAVVGLPGWKKIREHQLINRDIARWIDEHPEVRVHVPVDSPAANFPICGIAKKAGRQVVHLVAPQLWAWGEGRIKKLRRCSDEVLCLLPFEEPWFRERGVKARFIGHPLFDEELDLEGLDAASAEFPKGAPKIGLLPGSRPAEIRRNFPVMVRAFRELRETHPEMVGVVGAASEAARDNLYHWAGTAGGWPEGVDVVTGQADVVGRWCDVALVVSGTVSLQLARHTCPMIIMYKTNELAYKLVARWLIRTPFFTLPNLIAGREIVPELVPYFSGTERLVEAARGLIDSDEARESQRRDLRAICDLFDGHNASREAADALEARLGLV